MQQPENSEIKHKKKNTITFHDWIIVLNKVMKLQEKLAYYFIMPPAISYI